MPVAQQRGLLQVKGHQLRIRHHLNLIFFYHFAAYWGHCYQSHIHFIVDEIFQCRRQNMQNACSVIPLCISLRLCSLITQRIFFHFSLERVCLN